MKTVSIHPFTWMMMKPSISGTKRLEFRPNVFSVSEKKTTSGSMVQVHVVHVLKFTMTVGKNMAAVNQDVQ